MDEMVDENRELPDNFLMEIYKWALECKYIFITFLYLNDIFVLIFI